MITETNTPAVVPASPSAIVFSVKANDIVTAKVANVRNQPPKGILVEIDGNPMAFMPNGCIAGKNDAEKNARRAFLIANAGTEISVSVLADPTIETRKGKEVGFTKVSEQRAVIAAEKAKQAVRAEERNAAMLKTVESLVVGSVVEGIVRGPASKDSDRNPGTKHVYGAFVQIADGVSGLLHGRQIEGGDRALEAILAAGKVMVEIQEVTIEDGQPRIKLSQKSVGQKALAGWATDMAGRKVKGKVVKTGEQVDNMHGRIIELLSGDRVFLGDDDMNVKSETSLAKGNTTTVIMTADLVGGMVRVTRRGV
jgi:ribosomal protein S1